MITLRLLVLYLKMGVVCSKHYFKKPRHVTRANAGERIFSSSPSTLPSLVPDGCYALCGIACTSDLIGLMLKDKLKYSRSMVVGVTKRQKVQSC